jgi:hypothetical protein
LPQRFAPEDRLVLTESIKLLKEVEDLWKKYTDKCAVKPQDKVAGMLRQSACLRRTAYLCDLNAETQKKTALSSARQVIEKAIALFPDDPIAHYTLGMTFLDGEDYAGAYKALKTASEKGMKTPELERILAALGGKTEILDTRPSKDRRSFGPRPLIGGTLQAAVVGAPKKVTMKIGEKIVEPTLVGTQPLYVPLPAELPDGDTTVAISVTDAYDHTTEFPPFTFGLDKRPPSWTVKPDGSAPVSGKTTFEVTVSDPSGVDYTTVRVTLKETSAKKGGRTIKMIDEGRYKISMAETTPAHKISDQIGADTFQVSAGGQELTPGTWELSISAADMAGNVLNDAKAYTVNKSEK